MRTIGLGLFIAMLSPAALAAKDYRFEYADEDLLSPKELFQEISTSTARYCRDINDIRNLRAIQVCQRRLVAIVIEEIGNPRLSAFAESGTVARGKG